MGHALKIHRTTCGSFSQERSKRLNSSGLKNVCIEQVLLSAVPGCCAATEKSSGRNRFTIRQTRRRTRRQTKKKVLYEKLTQGAFEGRKLSFVEG